MTEGPSPSRFTMKWVRWYPKFDENLKDYISRLGWKRGIYWFLIMVSADIFGLIFCHYYQGEQYEDVTYPPPGPHKFVYYKRKYFFEKAPL